MASMVCDIVGTLCLNLDI